MKKTLIDWMVRAYCSWFGHALKVPVYPNPFAPIHCLRCGWSMDEDTE